jgi:hypothetical protein
MLGYQYFIATNASECAAANVDLGGRHDSNSVELSCFVRARNGRPWASSWFNAERLRCAFLRSVNDLFARCNALPVSGQYDYSARGAARGGDTIDGVATAGAVGCADESLRVEPLARHAHDTNTRPNKPSLMVESYCRARLRWRVLFLR